MPLNVSPSEKQELLVVFASLALHDDKVPITAENITKLITAAGATVEPYWPKLFASLLEGRDVSSLLLSAGSGSAPAAAPAAGGAAAAAGGDKAAAKEEPKKKEKSEESEADMGFSLFD
jgi:large subunit ribosomal protein LP1